MNYRDYLQQLIYKIINPLIHGMIKIGITPNFITTTGFILNVVAAGRACGTSGKHEFQIRCPLRFCA